MNVENILKVADAIEQASLPLGFNMYNYYVRDAKEENIHDHTGRDCGTVGCIAGWAAFIELGPDYHNNYAGEIFEKAAEFLELGDEAYDLFMPVSSVEWCDITANQAVTVLRYLAQTGKVDWSVAGVPPLEKENNT